MARSPLVLRVQGRHDDGASTTMAASLRVYPRRWQPLWFRVPHAWSHMVTPSADPFILGCFQYAMARRRDLVVEGAAATPGLLANLERAQRMLHGWWPDRYVPVGIAADAAVPDEPLTDGILAAFSGGADSCYTVIRHVRQTGPGPYAVPAAGVMVHGFDVALDREDDFRRASARCERTLASLGIPLMTIATNVRVLPSLWLEAYGGATASALSLLAGGFRGGVMAADIPFFEPHGSHADLDPLFSGSTFSIDRDGTGVMRHEKIEAIATWDAACADLRVCWQNRADRATNCCRCEKCVRTILMFRAVGVFPPCFEEDVPDDTIARLRISPLVAREIYRPFLTALRERGERAAWVGVLEEAVERNERRPPRDLAERIPPWLRLRIRMMRGAR